MLYKYYVTNNYNDKAQNDGFGIDWESLSDEQKEIIERDEYESLANHELTNYLEDSIETDLDFTEWLKYGAFLFWGDSEVELEWLEYPNNVFLYKDGYGLTNGLAVKLL